MANRNNTRRPCHLIPKKEKGADADSSRESLGSDVRIGAGKSGVGRKEAVQIEQLAE